MHSRRPILDEYQQMLEPVGHVLATQRAFLDDAGSAEPSSTNVRAVATWSPISSR